MGHLLASSSGGGGILFFYLVFYIVFTLGAWGTYKKAGAYGAPAWSAFVPVYSFIVLLKIAGRPTKWAWFLLLLIVPIVGSIALLVVSVIVLNDVSKSFGHGGGFTVGLVLLGPIFWYILWLGQSQYRGPAALAGGYGNMPPGGGYPPAGGGYPPAGGGYPPPGGGYPPPPPPPPPSFPPPPNQPPTPPGSMPPLQ